MISSSEGEPQGKNRPASGTTFLPRELIFLLVAMLLFAAIRWRLRNMPMERDEGEYAYVGQLILQGIPPYQIAYNMKLPGTYAAYAAILAVFGQTAAGIRIGLAAANLLTILLVYALGKRLAGSLAGAVAGTSYGLLSIGPWVNGFAGHATHFVVLAATAGLWLLRKAIDEQRDWEIFLAGVFLGLAFLMKQPGAAYVLFGALYLLKTGGRGEKLRASIRRLLWFGAGAVLPFAITCLTLWWMGVFTRFWFWTFSYAYQYGTSVSAGEGWKSFVDNFLKAFHSAAALWLLAAAGLSSFLWNRKARSQADFLLGLLFFSAVATSAGLYFRAHYFILLLPVVSLFTGFAISSAANLANHGKRGVVRYVAVAAFLGAFAMSVFSQRYFLFQADSISASRYVYPIDPFPEAAAVGAYLREHSSPSAQIAVLGSEPQILFYARRRSATGYLYSYSLTEEQKYAGTMQQEAIAEINAARPEYIVYVADWVIRPRSDRTILAWAKRYVAENYESVGVMRVRDGMRFRSMNEIARAPGNLTGALFLYRRKTA